MIEKAFSEIRFEVLEGPLDDDLFQKISDLKNEIFGSLDGESWKKELVQKPRLLTVVAFENEKLVGYKMGYERKAQHFYSWLGGVAESARGKGLARKMMEIQHNWLVEKGYSNVRTHTKNRWRAMLLLNIKTGFDIIGTFQSDDGSTTIMLEKRLLE